MKNCTMCKLPIDCSMDNGEVFRSVCNNLTTHCLCDVCYFKHYLVEYHDIIKTDESILIESLNRIKKCKGILCNKSVEEARIIVNAFIIATEL